MKKIIAFLLGIVICICPVSAKTVSMEYEATDLDTPLAVTASSDSVASLDIKAKAVILMEPLTNTILYEDNADEKLAPASITKIMALLLTMEAIEDGTIALDTVITASEYACSMGGSQIWLEPGEQMTLDELLRATAIASANDATVAIGEAIAGSPEGFIALMNERAKELGMNNTNFVNCTGLDAENHYTTAHDIAIMSSELIKHELIKKYTTVWMDSLRNGESELVNTNKLVRFYEGCTGLKTGTTSNAGYCLAATADKNGMQLVAVVLNAESSNERFEGAKKLLNYGYANYSFVSIDASLSSNTKIKTKNATEDYVSISPKGKLNLLLPKTASKNISQELFLDEFAEAPKKAGDTVGYVKVTSGDEELGIIEIQIDEDIAKMNIPHAFWWLVKALFSL